MKSPAAFFAFGLGLMVVSGSAFGTDFTVSEQMIQDRKTVFGTVEPVDQTIARTRLAGTVAQLSVDEGDMVEAGALLALVTDPKIAMQLSADDQRLRSLEAEIALAQTEWERSRDLLERGVGTKKRADDAKTALEVVQRRLKAMVSERGVLAQRVTEGGVLAPAQGRVLKVHVTPGSVVQPGEVVATIATGTYVLRLHLPERHARSLKEGDSVEVGEGVLAAKGAAARDGTATDRLGIVAKIYPKIIQGRVVADVEVEGLGTYFVGERVRVSVAAGQRRGFVVPPEFVTRRFGLDLAQLKDGPEVVVQTGARTETGIEILSGLRAGDVLQSH